MTTKGEISVTYDGKTVTTEKEEDFREEANLNIVKAKYDGEKETPYIYDYKDGGAAQENQGETKAGKSLTFAWNSEIEGENAKVKVTVETNKGNVVVERDLKDLDAISVTLFTEGNEGKITTPGWTVVEGGDIETEKLEIKDFSVEIETSTHIYTGDMPTEQ